MAENGEVIIRHTEMSEYLRLKRAGYTTAWVGEGKICLVPPRKEAADGRAPQGQ